MREIKFKAWDKSKGKMCNAEWRMKIDLNGNITWLVDHYDGYLNLKEREETDGNDRFILMQYTGLKDKSGKEIYEGDIVKFKTREQGKEEFYESIKRVMYVNGGFEAGGHLSDWNTKEQNILNERNIHYSRHFTIPDLYYQEYDFEIIGNIYENPELLKS